MKWRPGARLSRGWARYSGRAGRSCGWGRVGGQEEINGYSQRTSVGTYRGTLNRLLGTLSRAHGSGPGVLLRNPFIDKTVDCCPAVQLSRLSLCPSGIGVTQWALTNSTPILYVSTHEWHLYPTISIIGTLSIVPYSHPEDNISTTGLGIKLACKIPFRCAHAIQPNHFGSSLAWESNSNQITVNLAGSPPCQRIMSKNNQGVSTLVSPLSRPRTFG